MTKSAMIRYKIEKRYHIGQIIYAAKILTNENWKNLSIHKSKSADYTIEILKKQETEEIPRNSSQVCYAMDLEIRDEYEN